MVSLSNHELEKFETLSEDSTSMNEPILFQVEKNIATLTFNRPETLNAMDETMGKAFGAILKQIKSDPQIRVVIITGAGRAFSSGGNLEMLESKIKKKKATNQKELQNFYKTFLEIRKLPIPVIAAINGPAVGAGFCLALACDLRYAATTAKLGANFARLGLAPGMGGTYLITRLVGPTMASEILLTGNVFEAEQALDYGLLNDAVAAESLMDYVKSIATKIAQNGPVPVRLIKKGIQMAMHKTLEQMFIYDSAAQATCFATQDIKEGIAAIRQKRTPNFVGK